MKTDNINAFQKGWRELKIKHQHDVRKEIMDCLDITTKQAFFARRRGVIKPLREHAQMIEQIFAKYGIKASEVWGL